MESLQMDCDKENADQCLSETGWIQTQLIEMNLTVPKILTAREADKEVLTCIQALMNDRLRMKDCNMTMSEENAELRRQLQSLERSHEVQTAQLEVSRQDYNNINSRLMVFQAEMLQRKTQWSAEKSELESKVFQALSLQQSTLGTMRKKEKDFDTIQSQLMKHVRDSQKGQKSVITVTKALPRTWNSTKPEGGGSLRDAEMTAVQANLTAAEGEIASLRQCLNAVNTAVPKTVDSLAKDAEILEMRNALTAKEEDIKDLARKLDEAATSAFVAKEVTSQELAAVQEEIAKADAETQDCRMQITLKENEVLALMAQIGALNEQIRAGRGVTVALQLQLSSLESEVAATKAEILRVSKELHVTSIAAMQSDSANAMLRNEMSAISAAKQTLQCKLDAIQLEHSTLETKEREVREALAESVLQIHALEQQLLLAQSERTTAQSEAAALRICIETLNIEREGLQQALDNKTAQLKQDAAENGALRAEIETLSMKTRDYEQTVQMLTVEQDLRARAETREESERRERIASVAQLLAVQTDSANKIRFAEEKAMAAVEHVERDLLETRTLLADKGKALMTAQDEGLSRLREIEALQLQLQGASSNSKSQEELAALQGEMEVVKKRLKDREAVDTTDVVKALARVRELEAELVAAESERRRLRSLIAELKGNVRVFARVRPFLPGDGDTAVNTLSESTVVVNEDACTMRVCNLGERREDAIFSFDKTYGPSTSQDRIFSDVSEYVQSALDGYNVCLMSYGQTGSGKTHTMSGCGNGPMRGIIPRALQQIGVYKSELEAKGWEYVMEVSYVEIYNETIRDLLRATYSDDVKHEIKKDVSGATYISDVTMLSIDPNDEQQMEFIIDKAAKFRSTGATAMNEQSSRSHAVFTLHLRASNAEQCTDLKGTLSLVDLAGSERLERSGATGQRMRETISINKSLSALVDVFAAIATKQPHIPFRNSKLTYLLQPALSGEGKALMMVNLSPTEDSAFESLSSLRFAAQVNQCELGKAKRNVREISSASNTPLSATTGPAKKMARTRY